MLLHTQTTLGALPTPLKYGARLRRPCMQFPHDLEKVVVPSAVLFWPKFRGAGSHQPVDGSQSCLEYNLELQGSLLG